MNDGFRVGTRMVNVAALFEAFTKTCMVVNLAVEDQPDAFRAAMHRLISRRRKIDDREPAKTKPTAFLVKEQRSFIVRPAMPHFVAHALDKRQANAPFARAVFPDSANATHRVSPK